MTASNFAHLEPDFPAVHAAASSAERLAMSEPEAAAILAGKAVELALGWAFAHDAGLTPPAQVGASRMINDPDLRTIMGQKVHAKARFINLVRNKSAHEGANLKPEGARQVVEELHHVLHWFGRTYARRQKPPEPNDFDPAPLTARLDLIRAARGRIQSTEKALEARSEELEDLRARYASLHDELKAKRADVAKARADQSADPHDYKEATTRLRLIDLLLAESGWSDLKEGRDLEYRVEPMPNEQGHGFADYVLWGADGLPLAVVEAKRTRRSPSEGQQQAKLYADALEQMHGRRPVIFYTNGYEHWIWDDARNIPPRRLGGFKTAQELGEMIARRTEAKALVDQKPKAAIAGRPYQTRALTRIADHFDAGSRKALLVMATGTGKTRTVIALVDMMVRAGLVKRALFLCDRISLVRQARNAFAQQMPDSSPVNLVTDPSGTGRVYVSTYPTMMNLIDRADHSGRRFGPGHFDLVIIDEAHRSIYKRYRAIFEWFDSYLVGLTATPRDEVDRDTYRLFDLDPGHPTDFYGLEEAIEDGFLVPFEPISLPTRFIREGIRYDDLSDEEKDQWDELDWGETGRREEVTAGEINKYLFNADTVDKVLAHVMEHGIRVAGGDKIGKTIIFAASKRHAEFIEERFNAGWPNYGGTFARRIVHGDSYAQSLIEAFEIPGSEPHIAISVDMMDTGVDVPEVVNLVFFKLVRSKTKFWQMVGRGTRLRPDLFGPGEDKTAFRIFDVCGNLEFFGSNPELKDPSVSKSLTERLIEARLKVAQGIDDTLSSKSQAQHDDDAEDLKGVRAEIVSDVRRFVMGLDISSFVVRGHLRSVETWQADDAPWSALSEEATEEITGLAALPSGADLGGEEAKRFDLVMFELQLSLMGRSTKMESCRRKVMEIATALSTKLEIPAVARHAELIEDVLTDGWWEGLTVPIAERARLRLRDIVHLIDQSSRSILYTDFEDDLGAATPVPLNPAADFAAFKKKAREFLQRHGDHVALRRLRAGKSLTRLDIEELERMLLEAGVGSDADIEIARKTESAQVGGFGVFLRSIVGLDRAAAQEYFAEFIADGASADQIEFVGMVIEHLTRNGVIDPGLLYDSPFSDLTPDGPDSVFNEREVDRFLDRLRTLNQTAVVSDASADVG
ncbi:DEAD/DEAH box helicase family protein [Roseovarius indicus]|uniref:Restriction endonuclease subunit R n=1 Tax=Roseovarius indicus TaxID=540747 RepID=A0A0T5PCW5_9RHOB|nr:DEAD/DEAH box helicase family protein [Roseovarius indicus]KRS18963.1 restriction endonuclease subunit R [Roseovarius indicus]QEW26105.1 Type-1 restriction enzyme R protein [Roseovarius indicus]SFD93340.1 type I restriction enzyme, R subunit [Roseovarius indicus]